MRELYHIYLHSQENREKYFTCNGFTCGNALVTMKFHILNGVVEVYSETLKFSNELYSLFRFSFVLKPLWCCNAVAKPFSFYTLEALFAKVFIFRLKTKKDLKS